MDRRPSGPDAPASRRAGAVGLVGLVALSVVLTAAAGGATPLEVGLLAGVGAVTGGALAVAIGVWP